MSAPTPEPRDIRLSPDGYMVAIRTDYPEDGDMAYGVMDAHAWTGGGHYKTVAQVADWAPADGFTFPVPTPEQPTT